MGARFEAAVMDLERRVGRARIVVVPTSPGGSLDAGIEIGEVIHTHRYDTAASGDCVSSCALAWAAGDRRMILPGSSVSFHSSYLVGDELHADGTGNAKMGAYLREMGYSLDTISRLVGHDPSQFNGTANTTSEMILSPR
jgi:hypothetical protein